MQEIEKQIDQRCFLCGATLAANLGSVEHVFPKWLLRDGNLFNETLFFINGSTIPYRQCTIPCCVKCNSGPLSKLEIEVRNAFRSGCEGVQQLKPERLSLWMAKIYYGVILRGNLLPTDRANPSRGAIVPEEVMQILTPLRTLLQRIRNNQQISADPNSTFVTNVHQYKQTARNFDWMASTIIGKPGVERFVPALAIRHNGVGVTTAFGDGGALKKFYSTPFDEFAAVQLHPVQFIELSCQAIYKHSLMRDRSGYWTNPLDVYTTVSNGGIPESGTCWNQWDNEEYAMYFSRQLRDRPNLGVTTLSEVFPANGQRITFLHWPDGTRRAATTEELL